MNSFDPDYGVYLGELSNLADGDIRGKVNFQTHSEVPLIIQVYVVNETALQIINFNYNGRAPGFLHFSVKSDSSRRIIKLSEHFLTE